MDSEKKWKPNRKMRIHSWFYFKRIRLSVRWDMFIEPFKRRLGWPVRISTMEELEANRELYQDMPDHLLREYNLYKCKQCEELYTIEVEDSNDPENYYVGDCDDIVFNDEKEGLWCQYCEETSNERGNTILVVEGSEVSKIVEYSGIGKDWGAMGYEGFEPVLSHMRSVILQLNPHYHRTDGWRGYDVFDTPSGYVNVRTGWVGSGSSGDFHDIMEKVAKGEYDLAYPVIVVIATTSNIFSVNIDVYVPEENEKDFERLFTGEEHVDFDSEDEHEVDSVTAMAAAMTLPRGGMKVEQIGEEEDGKVKISVKQKSMDVWKPESNDTEGDTDQNQE